MVYAQMQNLQTQAWDPEDMKMTDIIPVLVDALGTDSILILDGRTTLDNMIQECTHYMYRMRKVQDYRGFIIYKGNKIKDGNQVIYKSLQMKKQEDM